MELVQRLSLLEGIYHAAVRYERDEYFRRGVEQPLEVARMLRESAERIERMHEEHIKR
jgi:hypothetical protein